MRNENELSEDRSDEGGKDGIYCCVEGGNRRLELVEIVKYFGGED